MPYPPIIELLSFIMGLLCSHHRPHFDILLYMFIIPGFIIHDLQAHKGIKRIPSRNLYRLSSSFFHQYLILILSNLRYRYFHLRILPPIFYSMLLICIHYIVASIHHAWVHHSWIHSCHHLCKESSLYHFNISPKFLHFILTSPICTHFENIYFPLLPLLAERQYPSLTKIYSPAYSLSHSQTFI